MRIPGKRVRKTRLIQTDEYVVAIEIEMVIPEDDPSEPCFESETVKHLKEVQQRAERGDVKWLAREGKVYKLLKEAA